MHLNSIQEVESIPYINTSHFADDISPSFIEKISKIAKENKDSNPKLIKKDNSQSCISHVLLKVWMILSSIIIIILAISIYYLNIKTLNNSMIPIESNCYAYSELHQLQVKIRMQEYHILKLQQQNELLNSTIVNITGILLS